MNTKHPNKHFQTNTNSKLMLAQAREIMEKKLLELGFSSVDNPIAKHLINNALTPITLSIEVGKYKKACARISGNVQPDMSYLNQTVRVKDKDVSFTKAMEMVSGQPHDEANANLQKMGFTERTIGLAEQEVMQTLKHAVISKIPIELANKNNLQAGSIR